MWWLIDRTPNVAAVCGAMSRWLRARSRQPKRMRQRCHVDLKYRNHNDNQHNLPDSFRINYRSDRDARTGADIGELNFPSSLRGALRSCDEIAAFEHRDNLYCGDVPLTHPIQGVFHESVIALLGQMAHERNRLLCG